MSYVNVGARIRGRRPTSKKAVREALAADPASVTFDPTSMFDQGAGPSMYHGDTLVDTLGGRTLSLVGPDPYCDRRFYGSVSIVKGKVVVR